MAALLLVAGPVVEMSIGLILLYWLRPARSSAAFASLSQYPAHQLQSVENSHLNLLRMRFIDTLYRWISAGTVPAWLAFGALHSARIQ